MVKYNPCSLQSKNMTTVHDCLNQHYNQTPSGHLTSAEKVEPFHWLSGFLPYSQPVRSEEDHFWPTFLARFERDWIKSAFSLKEAETFPSSHKDGFAGTCDRFPVLILAHPPEREDFHAFPQTEHPAAYMRRPIQYLQCMTKWVHPHTSADI